MPAVPGSCEDPDLNKSAAKRHFWRSFGKPEPEIERGVGGRKTKYTRQNHDTWVQGGPGGVLLCFQLCFHFAPIKS